MKLLPLLLASVLAPLFAAGSDEPTPVTIKLTNPDKPAILRLSIPHGEVTIVGSDRTDISVESSAEPQKKESVRPDGLRVISSSVGYSFAEKDNVVEIRSDAAGGGGAEFNVRVPKTTSVEINNNWGSEVTIESISGDIDIRNLTGEVTLKHVSGGALVETMNGEIDASFDALPTGKPLSFTSMNGEVMLKLPADSKANVRLRTQNGTILTDFPEDTLKTKTETSAGLYGQRDEIARAAREAYREAAHATKEAVAEARRALKEAGIVSGDQPPAPPKPPVLPAIPSMVGGKVVSGTLNGGGTEIQVATMNGDIVVRKLTNE